MQGFARYERNGIIFLSLLIILSIVAKKYITSTIAKRQSHLIENDYKKIALLQQQINEAKENYSSNYKSNKHENDRTNTTFRTQQKWDDFKIEVNSATEEEYDKLYGIGKVLSARIITFRNKLGGFYAVEQIKDVYGVEDSVFQKFKKNLTIKAVKPRKININIATYEELTQNPYFFPMLAKQIISYRTTISPFIKTEDIKHLYYVKEHPEQFKKLAPYIDTELE